MKAVDFVELWLPGMYCMWRPKSRHGRWHTAEKGGYGGGRQPESNSRCYRLAIPVSLLCLVSASNLLISSWFGARNRPKRAENTKHPHRHTLSLSLLLSAKMWLLGTGSSFFFSTVGTWRHGRLGSTPSSYSSGLRFKSQTGYRLLWLRILVDFLSVSRKMPGQCLKLSYDRFLPHPLRSITLIIMPFDTISSELLTASLNKP
jgi:hypothetical protein